MNDLTMTLVIFTVCSLVNVMLNTIKTLVMYKKNVLSSAVINAITYGFYTIIVVLMAGEMPLGWKIGLTAITNFVGVACSMLIMKRFEKDRLWKVEASVNALKSESVKDLLTNAKISFNYIEGVGKYDIFNIFCENQAQSVAVKEILKAYNVKYFVSESKTL